ncbi:MAG: hypothetical protein HXK70_05190 [Clostridiales bacterium]|nr:hypothetical protein [Clostridiales bacterium]
MFKKYLFFIIKILIVTGSINIVNEKLLYLPLLIIISFDIAKQFINKKMNDEVIHIFYVILLLVNIICELQREYQFVKLFSALLLFILYFIIEKIENKDDSD